MISLKTESKFFQAIWDKKKTCEVRYSGDRDFTVGCRISLLEIDLKGRYTGRELSFVVTHVLSHEDFPQGLQPNYVCLSFQSHDMTRLDRKAKQPPKTQEAIA